MRIHRNAKTTPMTRYLLVERVAQQRWRLQDACGALGISRQTGRKWLRRYQRGGTAALMDRSSAPRRQARQTPAAVTAAIIALRYERLTAWAIATRLQVPRSTVATVLARAGLNRLARLDPPPPVRRYERTRPGELIHLDIKKLARIGAVGHRIHGDLSRKTTGLGWEYVHVCVDDYSRAAYVEALPAKTGEVAAQFVRRAVRWFAARGVRVERVLTDNDGAYRARVFEAELAHAAVRHRYTRPYRPQTNGKAERFIQTLLREWAYAQPYATSARRTRALRPWLRHYNTHRPHTSLGYRPPAARFPRVGQ